MIRQVLWFRGLLSVPVLDPDLSPPPKLKGSKIREANDVRNCQYVGNRIARKFNGLIYFGTVTEKMGGAVLARQPDVIKLWQSVWKVVYDDQDTEELNRLEVID